MSLLPITMTFWNYDRTRALVDGTVRIEGCDARHLALDIHDIFWRAIRHQEFDVTEMSFSSYCMMRSRGETPYLAIPVFLSRLFRHGSIFVRSDRGIEQPADLKGKIIGVPEYQMSAALWARGVLEDEYAVSPRDISWRTGGQEDPGRPEKLALALPAGIEVKAIPPDQALTPLLEAGEIDGLISALPPSSFGRDSSKVRRLFADFRAVEQAYFAKTRVFPIMHVLCVRKALVDQHPWLANNLYLAFDEAKRRCLPELSELGAAKVTLPWIGAEVEETIRLMGADYWPYGVEKNMATLETLVRYSHDQGLSARRLAVEELFVPATLETAKL